MAAEDYVNEQESRVTDDRNRNENIRRSECNHADQRNDRGNQPS